MKKLGPVADLIVVMASASAWGPSRHAPPKKIGARSEPSHSLSFFADVTMGLDVVGAALAAQQ